MARILVVNDEPDLLFLCRWILESAGHVVEGAIGGPDIAERAERFRPDLVLVDWVMPQMTGDEVIRRLRRSPVTAHIPIILMSALADGASRAANLGVSDFLAKPFDEVQLLMATDRALEARGSPTIAP